MGFARIRWKWREVPDGVRSFLDAWQRGEIEGFLRANVLKVVIENRCNSAQPPGETLVSLALVAGLLANLDEAQQLALAEPYSFWLSVLDASMTEPVDACVDGRSIAELRPPHGRRRPAGPRATWRGRAPSGPSARSTGGSRSVARPPRTCCASTVRAASRRCFVCARIGVPERVPGRALELVPDA